MILDEHKKNFTIAASFGIPKHLVSEMKITAAKSISGFVIQKGEPLLVEYINGLSESLPQKLKRTSDRHAYKSSSFLSAPLMFQLPNEQNKRLGVINLTDRASGAAFSERDLKVLSVLAQLSAISISNSRLVKKHDHVDRVVKEAGISLALQNRLLPVSGLNTGDIDLNGRCLSAQRAVGDFYDYFRVDSGKVCAVSANVSGYNVTGVMGKAKKIIRSLSNQNLNPAQVLAETNRRIYSEFLQAELVSSMIYMSYEPQNRILSFTNSGHPHPILYRPSDDSYQTLNCEGGMFGIARDTLFNHRKIELKNCDIILLYSDGLADAMNICGSRFGEERLLEIVKIHSSQSSSHILNQIFQSVTAHIENSAQMDDMTALILKIA
ncbi:SpoIIE family protein phosphatase [candidate division KSB1 bacterium]|nr:SpoIIE family protein phosphatase [candidate division KSB1 bacterium]